MSSLAGLETATWRWGAQEIQHLVGDTADFRAHYILDQFKAEPGKHVAVFTNTV